ncbi:TPA: fimbria/pilus periplasmic chaperone [Klebsiella quasipneumoniae subsp. similipneumoniae]|nr:fimbria/pilus periplasmic chaperone [Klebsiella quasipneumoniae subsp. similipneumoniae]
MLKSCFFFIFFISYSASAIVNVEGTRVIFNEGEKITSVNLLNTGTEPALVQLWFDNGDILSSPQNIKSSVIAVPPVFKLNANEMRAIKLQVISHDNLSLNSESLLWLNIYQIPPNTMSSGGDKKVVLPLRIRLKVFVRPQGVGKFDVVKGSELRFIKSNISGKDYIIENPTKYHISMPEINIGGRILNNILVEPLARKPVILSSPAYDGDVTYDIINDEGNRVNYKTKIHL